MQNLQITATAPIVPAKQPASAQADNTAQATESFGNVLARQRAGAADAGKQAQGKQGNADVKDVKVAAAGKNGGDGPQAPEQTADAANAVQGDALAALLPGIASVDKTIVDDKAGKALKTDKMHEEDKADPKALAGGDAGKPAVLAALLPADAAREAIATVTARQAGSAVDENGSRGRVRIEADNGKAKGQLPGAVVSGRAGQQAADKLAAQPQEASRDAKALTHDHGKELQAASVPDTNKEKAFASALEGAARHAVKAEANLAKTHAVQDAPAPAGNLIQNGITAPVTGQSNTAQTTQAIINAPVADGAWGNEFNQRITWMATQQVQTAELHLNPPNLGPLNVTLNVSGDQASALFTSPHAAVRDAIEQALPRLRDMMADNGIALGNAMVSDQSAGNNHAWQAGQQAQRGGERTSGNIDSGAAAGPVSSGVVAPARRHNGMVDTFV